MKKIPVFILLTALACCVSSKTTSFNERKFSIHYSSQWEMVSSKNTEGCIFLTQKYKQEKSNSEWDLSICSSSGNLDEVMQQTVFYRDGAHWMASGSMDQQQVKKTLDSTGLFTLETTILPSCGTSDQETGFHAAGGECYSALVGCKKDFAILQSDGLYKKIAELKKIRKSIKFLDCRK